MPTRKDGFARRRIGAVEVAVATEHQAVAAVVDAIARQDRRMFGFCNAHTVVTAGSDPSFAQALQSATLFNDGVGLNLGSRILYGRGFPANLNGTDLTPTILSRLPSGTRVFLLGSPRDVAQSAGERLRAAFPDLEFVGCRNGFFADDEAQSVADAIASKQPQLVLVGMGHPRQEVWSARYGSSTRAVCLCVGAFLDFAAGQVRRAPLFVRKLRMEWVFRLVLEPRRLGSRYIGGNVRFFRIVFDQKSRRA